MARFSILVCVCVLPCFVDPILGNLTVRGHFLCPVCCFVLLNQYWGSLRSRGVCCFESRVFIENWKWVSKGCGSYLIHPGKLFCSYSLCCNHSFKGECLWCTWWCWLPDAQIAKRPFAPAYHVTPFHLSRIVSMIFFDKTLFENSLIGRGGARSRPGARRR